MQKERSRLLRRLAAEDFAVYEAILYLDGHPDCRSALAYYKRHRDLAMRLRAEYERAFGPLTNTGAECANEWNWVNGPWPWEKEAN